MFRDLKEYQEIQKLYTDKVSKPENLEERRGGNLSPEQIKKNQEGFKNRILFGNPEGKQKTEVSKSQQNRNALNKSRQQQNKGRVEKQFGFLKTKPSSEFKGSRSRFDDKKTEVKKEVEKKPEIKKIDPKQFDNRRETKPEVKTTPVVSDKTKQGKPRTKAQMMAAKRIASGKTIADVKQSNQDSMKAKAKARFAAFKAKRAEKKLDKQRDFDDPNKKMNRGESYAPDAYDFVLEYLLSSEQAATIEEANYVMTEMDAETIQGIVEEQKKNLDEMDMMKMPVINVLGGVASAVGGTIAGAKYLGRKAGERAIKKDGEKPGKPGLIKKMKDRTDATNKAIKEMP